MSVLSYYTPFKWSDIRDFFRLSPKPEPEPHFPEEYVRALSALGNAWQLDSQTKERSSLTIEQRIEAEYNTVNRLHTRRDALRNLLEEKRKELADVDSMIRATASSIKLMEHHIKLEETKLSNFVGDIEFEEALRATTEITNELGNTPNPPRIFTQSSRIGDNI